ncbi:MAG: ferritin-like domain-containing protein [Gemmatimonadaceae bacterium]
MDLKRLMDSIAAADEEIDARLRTRREAIRAGASVSASVAAGLALRSVPVALAAVATDAFAQGMPGRLPGVVVNVLNFALTLEHLEADFYTQGVGASGLLSGPEREVFDQIRKHEVAHVVFLQAALGAQAVGKPRFDFTGGRGSGTGPFADVFRSMITFAALSQAFEDTGVRAYKGQAAYLLGHEEILRSALQIHSVEARHAAQVRVMRRQKGWIVGDSRGDLPAVAEDVYDGEDNRFHILTATLGGGIDGPGSTESFDEPLTKNQVLDIVHPFLAT